MCRNNLRVGIIGGGVAGASVALYLSELGVKTTLFEKSKSLVNGPPICHLHAGGNLYRDISDKQCLTLLKESIELIRLYPESIDFRPTVIAVPIEDKGKPSGLFERLAKLQKEYSLIIEEDEKNKVLGDPADYYKLFSYEEILVLKEKKSVLSPKSLDEWMIPIAKNVDLEKLQFPLVMVQEYGINIFRLAAIASLWLDDIDCATVLTEADVVGVEKTTDSFIVSYMKDTETTTLEFDYLVNAAGFRSGTIDDMLGFKRERLVEFKAAYVTKCSAFSGAWPEVIFHGERGTPNGMAQFTPYPNGYFQLHGMTKDITLFNGGLVKSSRESSQPKLGTIFLEKIDKGWNQDAIYTRTFSAISHMAQYIPVFKNAKVMSKPLYGAQQIPGEDASLRAADISFEGERYARCEIVKASSVLNMADAITKNLIELGYLERSMYKKRVFTSHERVKEEEIEDLAQEFAQERSYPKAIASRSFSQV